MHGYSTVYKVEAPQVYSPGEEGEAQAWEMLTSACRQWECEWLR